MLSKVGDCMTASPNFLAPFSIEGGKYDLGQYADLQTVIDYFSSATVSQNYTALTNPGLATTTGYTTVSVQDPIWADPAVCDANESPLGCEYRVSNPAFALIMFGTNDTTFFEARVLQQLPAPDHRPDDSGQHRPGPLHLPGAPGIPGKVDPVQPDHRPDCDGL